MSERKKKGATGSSWGDMEFVNISLVDTQKDEFSVWIQKPPTPLTDLIGQAIVDDYKMSVGWDDNNQCFIATLTGKQDQKYNPQRSMSARSDDWYEAICLLMFKHHYVSKAVRWDGEKQRNNWG